ncbi:hypothetical protein TWF718_002891 [Orbilia javanica]|uniref:Hydrophobin n=1 Tax=Orbilia javanica TaxID=47235 RepID=A0AAN8RAE9_9PEZI
MYFPLITFLTIITSVIATRKNPEIPARLTIGEIYNRCDFGLSICCCSEDALDKPTEGGCFPLTEPELRPFRFVEICGGLPACCSTSAFDPNDLVTDSGSCEEITIRTEHVIFDKS